MIPSVSTSSETGDQVTWLSAGSSEAAWSLISQAGGAGLAAVDSRIFSQAAAGGSSSSRHQWESWENAMLQLAPQPQYSHHDNGHHASNVSYGNEDEDAYSKPSHGSSSVVNQLVMQAEPLLPSHHHHHHHHELVAGLRSNALMTPDGLLGAAAATSSSTTTAHSNYNSSLGGWGLLNMGAGSGRSSMGAAGLGHEAAAAVNSSSFRASAVAAMQHGYGSYGGLAGGYGSTLGGPPAYQLQADQRSTSSPGLLQLGQLANTLDQRRLQEILKSTARVEQLAGCSSTRLGLNLGLGGRTYFAADDYAFGRLLGKRHLGRPDSPLQQAPSCQAEGCKADLGMAKHYHRRHKVCEYHSKASTVIVGGQTQRFCQQCSRFHVLGEFDDGKRSCRKRLADHNRRRRKPQPTPVAPAATAASNGTSSSSEAAHATVAKDQNSTLDDSAAGNHHEEGEETHNDPSSRNGHTSQLINKDSAPGTPPVEHHEQKKQKVKDHTPAIAEASPTTASTSESEDVKVKAEAVSQLHHNVAMINSQGNWGNGGLGDIAEGGGIRSYSAERPVSSSLAWLKPAGGGHPDVRTKSHTTSDSNTVDGPNPLLQATSTPMHIKYNHYHHHHHQQLYSSNHEVASAHNKDDHVGTINEAGSDSSRIKTVQDGGTLMQRALFMHDSDGTDDDDNGDDDDSDDDDDVEDEASHHLTMTSGHTHVHHPLYNNNSTDDTASRSTLSSNMQRGSGQDLSRRQALMINGLDPSPAGHADIDGHNNIKLFSAAAAGDHHLQDFKSFTVNHRSIFGSGNLM